MALAESDMVTVPLIGRLPSVTWEGLEEKLRTCLATDGAVRLLNAAGRSMLLERSAVAPATFAMTVHAPAHLSDELRARGWVKHGKGPGAVVRNGWETGALPGPFLRRAAPTVAALLVDFGRLVEPVLSVTSPNELRYVTGDARWAEVLRLDPGGSHKRWHHAPPGGAAGHGVSAPERERVKDCRRCGQPLNDPVSVAREYGPECWRKMTNRSSKVVRPR